MTTYPIEYVEWLDSCSLKDSGWKSEGDLRDFFDERFIIQDVGFVTEETKDYLCLVGGFNKDLDKTEFGGHRELKIPRKAIVRRVKLKLPKRKK